MQVEWTLRDDQHREIPVVVTYATTGRGVHWVAQFSGTTHATGELAGAAADEGSLRDAVQQALLQAGVMPMARKAR